MTHVTHVPFVVIAHMAGPVCLKDPIHLDGLLLAAREKRGGPATRGQPFDGLARVEGVYQASVGLLIQTGLAGARPRSVARLQSLNMRTQDGHSIHFSSNARVGERTIGPDSSYRNSLKVETVTENVPRIVFQALGDPEIVLDLLSSEIACIGKMHRTGWGRVDRFEVAPSRADPSTCGLAAGGAPLRYLPPGLAASLGLRSEIVIQGRLAPPYGLSADLSPVVAPSPAALIVDRLQAAELLQY